MSVIPDRCIARTAMQRSHLLRIFAMSWSVSHGFWTLAVAERVSIKVGLADANGVRGRRRRQGSRLKLS